MDIQTYLMFELNGLNYGIKAAQVREIFQLPELTSIADAPGDIIGVLNYRGSILPIMHLAKRLGQSVPICRLSDSVIVLEWQGLKVGMIVHHVQDVQTIHASAIEPEPAYGRNNPIHSAFVAGVAKFEDHLITLLNPETVIRQTDDVALMIWEAKLNGADNISLPIHDLSPDNGVAPPTDEQRVADQHTSPLSHFFDLYCPGITQAERQLFHQRALELRKSLESSDISDLIALAVVGLGEEYFGLDLERVREFINIRNITPIPCCPPHILGNINLRGEVMTLVDIRKALNLGQSKDSVTKAIVIEVDDIVAGVTVDAVLDVIYLSPSDIAPMPTALPKRYQDFFQGAARYHSKTLSILDLSKLLFQGGLIVDQAA
ncbi:MAG: chemotaxis protein CheW [Leptolyngbyaceae cyanobacterium MO_188.B28]|nr:chemotaxis protein CheW [Leptolyngbyaceae cyanobacterium MO_188.B28]